MALVALKLIGKTYRTIALRVLYFPEKAGEVIMDDTVKGFFTGIQQPGGHGIELVDRYLAVVRFNEQVVGRDERQYFHSPGMGEQAFTGRKVKVVLHKIGSSCCIGLVAVYDPWHCSLYLLFIRDEFRESTYTMDDQWLGIFFGHLGLLAEIPFLPHKTGGDGPVKPAFAYCKYIFLGHGLFHEDKAFLIVHRFEIPWMKSNGIAPLIRGHRQILCKHIEKLPVGGAFRTVGMEIYMVHGT